MKKYITSFLIAILICTAFSCTHVHTKVCGPNGENCKHICYVIEPFHREPVDD